MTAQEVERDTYTAKEVAVILGVKPLAVYRYLKAGRIAGAEKFGRRYVIWKGPFDEQLRRDSERKAA